MKKDKLKDGIPGSCGFVRYKLQSLFFNENRYYIGRQLTFNTNCNYNDVIIFKKSGFEKINYPKGKNE